jgi:hypothetical protein
MKSINKNVKFKEECEAEKGYEAERKCKAERRI